jgi:hypothetical protein
MGDEMEGDDLPWLKMALILEMATNPGEGHESWRWPRILEKATNPGDGHES